MRIAIDISPIDEASGSNHKVRGVGKYISLLKDNLVKYDPNNSYVFTSNPQEADVDVIHYPYFDPFFITIPNKQRKKTVVTVHDVIPITHSQFFPSGIKGRIKWFINRSRLRNVDAIITDSHSSKEALLKVANIQRSMVFPVALAVDDDFKKLDIQKKEEQDLRSKYKLPDRFFLYVGDVTWNKNLPILLQAVKRTGTPLVMVGKALAESEYDRNHPWNNDRSIVESVTKDNLFIKLGFVPTFDLVMIYNLAIALCMISRDEGFGLPALEAMSCGCPVVLSQSGSLPEVGGDSALYVDPTDEDDIVRVLQTIASDQELQLKFSKKGIEQSKKFSLKKFIHDTVLVYEKAYKNNHR